LVLDNFVAFEAINTIIVKVNLCTSIDVSNNFQVLIFRIAEVGRGITFWPPFALGFVLLWYMHNRRVTLVPAPVRLRPTFMSTVSVVTTVLEGFLRVQTCGSVYAHNVLTVMLH
jgi:hypothetical protein